MASFTCRRASGRGSNSFPRRGSTAATARQTSNGSNPTSDWDQGYGYQFWRCRHGAYRGDGAFGQYCVVLPEQDAVIAITSGVKDMQAVLNLVWDKLLPAMKPSPLAADDEAGKKLQHALKGLSLRPQEGSGSAAKVSGKKYVFPANDRKLEAITLESEGNDGDVTLVTRCDGVEQRIACGRGAWRKGRAAWGSLPLQPAAASGAWTADGTFTAKLCFYETPFIITVTLEVLREGTAMQFGGERGFRADQGSRTAGEGRIIRLKSYFADGYLTQDLGGELTTAGLTAAIVRRVK